MRIVPFSPDHIDATIALWLELHPDWSWVKEDEFRKIAFEMDDDRCGFAVLTDDGGLVGTAIGSATRDPEWPRNRYLQLELKPEAVREDIVTPMLASMADSDRERPGTWQIINLPDKTSPELASLILGAGFAEHDISMRMEWNDETVPLADPGSLRIELYRGGSEATDTAIADLHNRAYKPARLVGPTKAEYIWPKAWPGLKEREFVLSWDGERLAGFAEWFVVNDEPVINSIVAARSHWGTPAAPAAGTRAMQRLVDLGYRTLISSVSSRNAPSYAIHRRHGWRRVGENSRNYVRKF